MPCKKRSLRAAERREQVALRTSHSPAAQITPAVARPVPGAAVASMSPAELREWLCETFEGRLTAEQLKAADEAFASLGLDGNAIVETVEPDSKGFQAADKLGWLGLETWLARALATELCGESA